VAAPRSFTPKPPGAPSYEDLIAQGYLSEAVVNYVALLGWAPGGEREIYSLPELVEAFDIKGISKSPAIFDIDKLKYFNSAYIRAMTPEQFVLGIIRERYGSADAYLEAEYGLTPARLMRLRRMYLE